jgi:hypothetical protein
MNRRSYFVFSALAFGYAFLYIPLVSVVIYSFNDSRLATVWGGFSTRWYGELLRNKEVLDAATLSLQVALSTATLATLLGTIAGLALARFGRFRGRTLFSGMITAPLVMPEVITGLSLLLLYVSLEQVIGWPEQRGYTTITIAHTTFALTYVTVVVQSRLAGMDESLEEAARRLRHHAAADHAGHGGRLAVGVHLVARRPGHREFRFRARRQHVAHGHLLQSEARGDTGRERPRHGDHRHRHARSARRVVGHAPKTVDPMYGGCLHSL